MSQSDYDVNKTGANMRWYLWALVLVLVAVAIATMMLIFPGFAAIANSQFSTAVVGSLAGAFAGAYAAQHIASRAKVRDEIVREVRNLNAAIAFSSSVASSAFNLKSQYVRDIHAAYLDEKKRVTTFFEKVTAGEIQGGPRVNVTLDLRTAPMLSTPIDVLAPLVYSAISVTGRPLNLCAALVTAIQNFNMAVVRRDRFIEASKMGQLPEGANLHSLYLGLPYGDGHVNEEFGDNLVGMATYLDDAIFFSTQLCAELTQYGDALVSKHRRSLMLGTLSVSRNDFSKQEADGLTPDLSLYQTWFTGFQKSKAKSCST